MESTIFGQLSLVIAVVAVVSIIMRLLRQPLIIGYILTGVVVGPSFLHLISDKSTFEGFSSIGIALLLFIIGLGLNFDVIRKLGKTVIVVATLEISMMLLLGFLVARALGMPPSDSLFLGAALTFSSTIIIVKVLNDKREQTRLYGQICIGILLVEDIVATIALLFLSTNNSGGISPTEVGFLALKGLALAGALTLISTKILPKLSKFIASSQELLFLFAIAWGFGVATLFSIAGFSLEVGALFAGVSLAGLPYAQEIAARLKPLRDFFVVVFFIVLGEGLQLHNLGSAILPAVIFSVLVIIFKPLLVMIGLGSLGYTKRTSFKAGLPIAQISEFSLILVVLAASYNLVSEETSAIVTLIALITIGATSYLMHYDDWLYAKLENKLRFFERRIIKEEKKAKVAYPVILFGYHKGGHEFTKVFRDMKKRYIVVDYNPEVIEQLEHRHIHFMYGDATDLELLQELGVDQAKLVVSVMTDFNTNLSLLKHVVHENPHAIFICHADTFEEANTLYNHGATYVMMPYLIGSERISNFLKHTSLNKRDFDNYRDRHLTMLESQLRSDSK
jgi:Kef-type K+ transport system membrane component KefB/Trk K+ transport system NAD-binding subunit